MAFFKVRVGDTTYELEKLTLGEARILKRDFGLVDLGFFSPTDPDQLVGLLALAIRRHDLSKTLEQATTEAESLDIEGFVDESEDDAEGVDPTPAADGGAATPAESGKSGKPRKTTGNQS